MNINIKKYKHAERIVSSTELNEGDPIIIEVKMKESGNIYRYIGRYVEVPEFKKNCISKDLRFISQEGLEHFKRGHSKLCNFNVIRGSKKVWLLKEIDVKPDYDKGFLPQIFKDWRKTQK